MITDQVKLAITTKLQEMFAEGDIKQSEFADKAQVNKAYVSKIKNGSYKIGQSNIPDEVFEAILNHIQIELPESDTQSYHFDNDNGDAVAKVVQLCLTARQVALIDSDISGAGKTYHLRRAAKHPKVLYVKTTKESNTPALLGDILQLLGVNAESLPKGNHDKIKLFREKMPQGWVLIVDELETVKNKKDVYGTLKDLADETEGRFGLILAGFNMIKDLQKKYDANRNIYAQLFSRCRAKVKLYKIREQDLVTIFSSYTNKLNGDVLQWTLHNIKDYRQLRLYFEQIVAINNEVSTAKERIAALTGLISPYIN